MWRVTKTKHRKKDRKQGRLIEKTKKTSFINLPSLRKQPTFRHHWFPCEVTPETRAEKFHTDDLPILRSGHCFWLVGNILRPIRSTTQIWAVARHGYGQEFLCSFFRRHFARKPPVASQDVFCFLRLQNTCSSCKRSSLGCRWCSGAFHQWHRTTFEAPRYRMVCVVKTASFVFALFSLYSKITALLALEWINAVAFVTLRI